MSQNCHIFIWASVISDKHTHLFGVTTKFYFHCVDGDLFFSNQQHMHYARKIGSNGRVNLGTILPHRNVIGCECLRYLISSFVSLESRSAFFNFE